MTRPEEGLASDDIEAPAETVPAEDLAEQSVPANPVEEPAEVSRGLEVNEWDAVEQSIVIDMDDDYDH
jgi:hypothetical protein